MQQNILHLHMQRQYRRYPLDSNDMQEKVPHNLKGIKQKYQRTIPDDNIDIQPRVGSLIHKIASLASGQL